MKKVVVTGATSFLGLELIKELKREKRYEIHAIIRRQSEKIMKLNSQNDVILHELNMDEYDKINEIIKFKPDILIHLAWEGTRAPQRDNKELQCKNFNNSKNLFFKITGMGCKRIIGIGSQAEYGNYSGIITEETAPIPTTYYGENKLNTYNYGMSLSERFGTTFYWARIFSLYGCGDFSGTLIMSMLEKLNNNEEINLTEGSQKWNYLYVSDAAKMIVKLIESNEESGAYNVASQETKLLKEYILMLKELCHSKSKLNFGAVPYPPTGKVSIWPATDKIIKAIGMYDEISFQAGIKKIIEGKEHHEKN